MSPRPPTWQEAGYRSHGLDVQKIGTKQVLSEYLDMQGGSGRVARAELIHDQRARRLESTNRWLYIVGRRSCGVVCRRLVENPECVIVAERGAHPCQSWHMSNAQGSSQDDTTICTCADGFGTEFSEWGHVTFRIALDGFVV